MIPPGQYFSAGGRANCTYIKPVETCTFGLASLLLLILCGSLQDATFSAIKRQAAILIIRRCFIGFKLGIFSYLLSMVVIMVAWVPEERP